MPTKPRYKKGYKVVFARDDGTFESACRNDILVPIKSRVRYEVGKPAVPKPEHGPLCVFADPYNAKRFARGFINYLGVMYVFSVSYKPSRRQIAWVPRTGTDGMFSRTAVAKLSKRYGPTRLADEVILEEECL